MLKMFVLQGFPYLFSVFTVVNRTIILITGDSLNINHDIRGSRTVCQVGDPGSTDRNSL